MFQRRVLDLSLDLQFEIIPVSDCTGERINEFRRLHHPHRLHRFEEKHIPVIEHSTNKAKVRKTLILKLIHTGMTVDPDFYNSPKRLVNIQAYPDSEVLCLTDSICP